MTDQVKNNDLQLLELAEKIKNKMNAGEITEVKYLVQKLEEQILVTEMLNKEDKLKLLLRLIKYYRMINDYNKCSKYCREAISFSKQGKNTENTHEQIEILIEIYLEFAGLERRYKKFTQARIMLANLLQMLESLNWEDPFSFGLLYDSLGKVNIGDENFAAGINQFKEALHCFKQSVDETHPQIIQTMHLMSKIFIRMERYEEALKLHQELLEVYKRNKDSVYEAKALLDIGEIYFYIDLRKAQKKINHALSLLKEQPKKEMDIVRAYLMLAEIDENTRNYNSAIINYKLSLERLVHIYKNKHFMIVFVYLKLGNLLIEVNRLNEASEYLDQGLKLASDFEQLRPQFYSTLGKVYTRLEAYEKANDYYTYFLSELEAQYEGRKTKEYARVLQIIAYNCLKQHHTKEALKYYNQARNIFMPIESLSLEQKGLVCKLRI